MKLEDMEMKLLNILIEHIPVDQNLWKGVKEFLAEIDSEIIEIKKEFYIKGGNDTHKSISDLLNEDNKIPGFNERFE